MIYQELLKLSPIERDIIICQRLLKYPKQLTTEELARDLHHDHKTIERAIKKFNKNCRAKLELHAMRKQARLVVEAFFYDEYLKR